MIVLKSEEVLLQTSMLRNQHDKKSKSEPAQHIYVQSQPPKLISPKAPVLGLCLTPLIFQCLEKFGDKITKCL